MYAQLEVKTLPWPISIHCRFPFYQTSHATNPDQIVCSIKLIFINNRTQRKVDEVFGAIDLQQENMQNTKPKSKIE
jgi:hypothetical protein